MFRCGKTVLTVVGLLSLAAGQVVAAGPEERSTASNRASDSSWKRPEAQGVVSPGFAFRGGISIDSGHERPACGRDNWSGHSHGRERQDRDDRSGVHFERDTTSVTDVIVLDGARVRVVVTLWTECDHVRARVELTSSDCELPEICDVDLQVLGCSAWTPCMIRERDRCRGDQIVFESTMGPELRSREVDIRLRVRSHCDVERIRWDEVCIGAPARILTHGMLEAR